MDDNVEGVAEIEFRSLSHNLRPQKGEILAKVRIQIRNIWLSFKLNMKDKKRKNQIHWCRL